MGDVEEIKETLKERHYSDKAIAEILKWYVNDSQASNKKRIGKLKRPLKLLKMDLHS